MSKELEQAIKLYEEGEIEKAIKMFEELVKDKLPETLYYYGACIYHGQADGTISDAVEYIK